MADLWECYEPEDGYGDREPAECEHENAEYDILEGEMSCSCGYHRWLSGDEIRREAQFQTKLMEAYYTECDRDG